MSTGVFCLGVRESRFRPEDWRVFSSSFQQIRSLSPCSLVISVLSSPFSTGLERARRPRRALHADIASFTSFVREHRAATVLRSR